MSKLERVSRQERGNLILLVPLQMPNAVREEQKRDSRAWISRWSGEQLDGVTDALAM
ncbi:hypothetical protein ACQ7HM_12655 [Williamsia sp. MIQD14]|uniref:hypothetical protein n=1 Tax=Williamsia sp. MIQD14 TaxID=3425703 RepID=UPI003DA0689E